MRFKKCMLSLMALVLISQLFSTVSFSAESNSFTSSSGKIAVSYGYTIAVKEDGTVWEWGHREYRDGLSFDSDKPVKIEAISGVKTVSAGEGYVVVLKKDGTVWSWGDNRVGQLGDGTTNLKTNPVQVRGLSSVVYISSFEDHSVALKADGTVWTWGLNWNYYSNSGKDKDAVVYKTFPVQVKGLTEISAVSTNSLGDILAIKKDGTVWCFGENYSSGKFILFPYVGSTPADKIKGLANVKSVTWVDSYPIAVKADGTVWSWGYLKEKWRDPVQINGLNNVVTIDSRFALKKDGTVWTFRIFRDLPYTGSSLAELLYDFYNAAGVRDVKEIVASDLANDAFLLKKDGTVWALGGNYHGEMGVGSSERFESFLPVPARCLFAFTADPGYKPVKSASYTQAVPLNKKVDVGGSKNTLPGYSINNRFYVRPCDIAMLFKGTVSEFNITEDESTGAIKVSRYTAYSPVGGELARLADMKNKTASSRTLSVYIGDVEFSVYSNNIGGKDYFRLSDIAQVINFYIEWLDDEQTILIRPETSYIGFEYEPTFCF